MTETPILPDPLRSFVQTWGEMGLAWGLGRSAGQVHGLVLAAGRPLAADEIAEALGVARSNVSAALKELRGAGLIESGRALGDRKERVAPLPDARETALRLAALRRARAFEPARAALAAARGGAPAIDALSEVAEQTAAYLDAMAALEAEALQAAMEAGPVLPPPPEKKKKKKK